MPDPISNTPPPGRSILLSEWVPDSAITQALTASMLWPKLTPAQRKLVASCRVEVDPKAEWPNRDKVIVDKLTGLSARTLKSLEAKGIVDERGVLTINGIYTALWHQLEYDEKRAAERVARKAGR